MDIVDIIFDIPIKLMDLTEVLKEFLFSTITIGDVEVSGWMLLSGVGLITLIILSIIRS